MKKDYQTRATSAATTVAAQLREAVSVTLAELAGSLREGLLALAVGAGFQVMEAIIEESVTALAGSKGRHDPKRSAARHGREDGSAGAPCRSAGQESAPPIRAPRWRCPPTSCSPRQTCSPKWRSRPRLRQGVHQHNADASYQQQH